MDYPSWEQGISPHLRDDPLWSLRVYRMPLYAGDLARWDARVLAKQDEYIAIADQLRRAGTAIRANIAEGFSRYLPRDRSRFFEYALGSAREARDWYHKSTEALGTEAREARLEQLGHIVRILTTLIARTRTNAPRGGSTPHSAPRPSVISGPGN